MTSGTPRSRASLAWTSLKIEPIDLAVDLDGDAVPRRGVDDRFDVDRVRLALQDPPAGRMAEDVDVRVLDGAQQAVGHLLPILVERGVHRGDHEVERGEAVVGEVERAVGLDVALDAGEQADAEPSASSARMRAACSSARRSSSPLAIASDWL